MSGSRAIRSIRIISRDTVRYQVQETYNELIPGPGELSAALLIEFPVGVEALKSIRDGMRIFTDHPKYHASTTLTPQQVNALATDIE
jgi:hypothetical protein